MADRYLEKLDTLRKLHEKKSADYGTSGDSMANLRASDGSGIPAWIGAVIRAQDKIFRLNSEAQRVMERIAFDRAVGLENADKVFAALGKDTPPHLRRIYIHGLTNENMEDSFLDGAAYLLLASVLYEPNTVPESALPLFQYPAPVQYFGGEA